MSEAAIVCTVLTAGIELMLMAFAVFCIGFFTGYKREENKILKKDKSNEELSLEESIEEKKAKKEWQRFLNYDGSSQKEDTF